MSQIVAQFDPASPATAFATSFNTLFPNKVGKIVVYNRSIIDVKLQWAGNTDFAPAQLATLFCISNPTTNIAWSATTTLNMSNPAASQITIVSYAPNEPIQGTFPAPLISSLNTGNSAGIQSGYTAETVQNANGGTTTFGGQTGKTTYLKAFTLSGDKAAAANTGELHITGLFNPLQGIAQDLLYCIDQTTTGTVLLQEHFDTPVSSAVGTGIAFHVPNLTGNLDLVVQYTIQ